MSYTTKSAILYFSGITISMILAFAVAIGLFIAFGAYSPDGISLDAYVYGISDAEGAIAVVAMVLTLLGSMTAIIGIGENHI